MAKAKPESKNSEPRRLPRGRHALAPEEVQADQRKRLIEAVPRVVAKHGYEAMSVADVVKAAAVSRNAFYNNFADKQECFAVAHEACHERLLALLERPCERGTSVEERVETALGAALACSPPSPQSPACSSSRRRARARRSPSATTSGCVATASCCAPPSPGRRPNRPRRWRSTR